MKEANGSGAMTKTKCFDGMVELLPAHSEDSLHVSLGIKDTFVSASLHFYDEKPGKNKKFTFVQARTAFPVTLRWKETFTVKDPDSGEIWGEGMVLVPLAPKITRSQAKRRLKYLMELLGDEKEMLEAVIRFNGIHGVQEQEIIQFGHHSRRSLLELCQQLETEGQIRILEFSPIFIVSQAGMAFLCDKILKYLAQFHENNPGDLGAPKGKIQNRFDVHPRILALALKHLVQEGKIKEWKDHVALFSFEMALLPDEKKILDQLERMYLKDKFHSLSMGDIQRAFHLSSKRLDKILSLLIDRKKIVLGRDGFILHSHWLDEIIRQVRGSGKRELTVAEFKEMTGLTRKFAIPLLELLDQMGVTRRQGSTHLVL
jgi:selenocysteine-specific elongation factor